VVPYPIAFGISNIYTSMTDLHSSEDVLDNLGGLGLTTHVGAQELALLKVGIDSLVDDGSGLLLVEELKHEGNTAEGSDGVGNVHALNVRGRTVARLTNGEALTNVGRGNETQTANKSSSTVGQDVTVEVRSDNNIVGLRLTEQLVDHAVYDLLVDGNALGLEVSKSLASSRAEETVCLRENVALVGDGDVGRLAGLASRVADTLATESNVTGHGSDTTRGTLGDALDGLGDLAVLGVVCLLLLDVQVLGVLADNDKVNGVGEHGGVLDALDGTNVGVQVEALAESDNGRRVALGRGGGRAHGTEESTIALLLQCVDGLLGQGNASLLEGLEASFQVDEGEGQTQRLGQGLEDATAGRNDLAANAITRDQTWIYVSSWYWYRKVKADQFVVCGKPLLLRSVEKSHFEQDDFNKSG